MLCSSCYLHNSFSASSKFRQSNGYSHDHNIRFKLQPYSVPFFLPPNFYKMTLSGKINNEQCDTEKNITSPL